METHASLCVAKDFDSVKLPEDCKYPSADVHHEVVDTLHISTVRHLRGLAYRAPVEGCYRWIVIFAKIYPHITQNALLKILEDPPMTTKIILVVPDINQLLPTVRSRLHFLYDNTQESTDVRDSNIEHWYHMTVSQRLHHIDRLYKQKNTEEMSILLNGVIRNLPSYIHTADYPMRKIFSDVVMCSVRSGASKRYLLEALALTVPDSLSTK